MQISRNSVRKECRIIPTASGRTFKIILKQLWKVPWTSLHFTWSTRLSMEVIATSKSRPGSYSCDAQKSSIWNSSSKYLIEVEDETSGWRMTMRWDVFSADPENLTVDFQIHYPYLKAISDSDIIVWSGEEVLRNISRSTTTFYCT